MMKLFTAMFDIAALPVKLAIDTVTLLPDLSSTYREPFERTREQCKLIDEDLSK